MQSLGTMVESLGTIIESLGMIDSITTDATLLFEVFDRHLEIAAPALVGSAREIENTDVSKSSASMSVVVRCGSDDVVFQSISSELNRGAKIVLRLDLMSCLVRFFGLG